MSRLPYVFMGTGILLAIGFAVFFEQRNTPPGSAIPSLHQAAGTYYTSAPDMATATVEYVIDGDTIVLQDSEHVRYIGMNAPEIAHSEVPGSADQCYGPEATTRNKELVLGKTISLGRDAQNKDKYGRLLRYIWVGTSTMIDLILVREGYARVLSIPPNTKYASQFAAAAQAAQAAKLGLWSACNNQ